MKTVMRTAIAGANGRIERLEANKEKLEALKKQIESQIIGIGDDINDAYTHRDELQGMFDAAM